MTVVRFKNRPNELAPFNNLLSDVSPQFPSFNRENIKQRVPVNIRETESGYLLDLIAPGYQKEDFSISLEKDLLSVSVENKTDTTKEGERHIRQEFVRQAFKRSFTLDEKINAEAISAQYVNGILTLNLPKKQEVKPATKQINIQ